MKLVSSTVDIPNRKVTTANFMYDGMEHKINYGNEVTLLNTPFPRIVVNDSNYAALRKMYDGDRNLYGVGVITPAADDFGDFRRKRRPRFIIPGSTVYTSIGLDVVTTPQNPFIGQTVTQTTITAKLTKGDFPIEGDVVFMKDGVVIYTTPSNPDGNTISYVYNGVYTVDAVFSVEVKDSKSSHTVVFGTVPAVKLSIASTIPPKFTAGTTITAVTLKADVVKGTYTVDGNVVFKKDGVVIYTCVAPPLGGIVPFVYNGAITDTAVFTVELSGYGVLDTAPLLINYPTYLYGIAMKDYGDQLCADSGEVSQGLFTVADIESGTACFDELPANKRISVTYNGLGFMWFATKLPLADVCEPNAAWAPYSGYYKTTETVFGETYTIVYGFPADWKNNVMGFTFN
jgi:hypothetical protein